MTSIGTPVSFTRMPDACVDRYNKITSWRGVVSARSTRSVVLFFTLKIISVVTAERRAHSSSGVMNCSACARIDAAAPCIRLASPSSTLFYGRLAGLSVQCDPFFANEPPSLYCIHLSRWFATAIECAALFCATFRLGDRVVTMFHTSR